MSSSDIQKQQQAELHAALWNMANDLAWLYGGLRV